MSHRQGLSLMRKHRGVSLLDVMIAIIILGVIVNYLNQYFQRKSRYQDMSNLGDEIVLISNSVASYIFDKGPTIPVGPTTYSGVSWLKDSSCGGPTSNLPGKGYLSCNFTVTEAPKYQLEYSTILTRDPAKNNEVTATINIGPGLLVYKGEQNSFLAAKAISHARDEGSDDVKDVSKGTIDGFIDYQYNPDTGLMNVVVDNSSDGTDPWLSITGENNMQADLDMGDGDNDIVNSRNVYWTGQPTSEEESNSTQSGLVTGESGEGAIVLNGRGSAVGGSITFFREGSDADFSVRISNQQDGELYVEAANGVVIDSNTLDVIGPDSQVAANDFYSKTTNRSLNQAVMDAYMANHNDRIPKPECDTANTGLEPTIYTAVSRFAGTNSDTPTTLQNLAAFQARAIDDGEDWIIKLDGIVQDEGYVVPPPDLASVLAVTKCS